MGGQAGNCPVKNFPGKKITLFFFFLYLPFFAQATGGQASLPTAARPKGRAEN